MKTLKTLKIMTGALLLGLGSCQTTPLYLDATQSPAARAADLVRRMSLEEKVGQLQCPYGWETYERSGDSVLLTDRFRELVDERHIGMLWGTFRADPWTQRNLETGLSPRMGAELANRMQRYAIEHSRWGIPLFLAEEAPHGFMAIGATVFPTALGQASTWNPELIRRMGGVIASEIRTQGAHIAYGPVLDVVRDPRWSRTEESYGEDPTLTAAMGRAFVEGLGSADLSEREHALSTLKHIAAYGASDGGQNGGANLLGERELRRTFLPPVEAAVRAGARSVMTAYNSIDGVPCTMNDYLLGEVLRGEWGFDGFVISDLFSIEGLYQTHGVATSVDDAARKALTAGVDADLCGEAYLTLIESVRKGLVDPALIDRAAERVLRLKFEMGLFENPNVDVDGCTSGSDAHRQTTLEVARQSIVLLENNGILPLSAGKGTVALIGPNADNVYNQLGDYTAQQSDNVTTLRRGIERLIGADRVRYVRGCAIRDLSTAEIQRAVDAARRSDVAVVVVGGSSARDFDTEYLATGAAVASTRSVKDMECGEGNDRASLALLGRQEELLRAVAQTGKPMVVVYIEGRPLDMRWASEHADALLTAWYPGEAGGEALAEVLFGQYNPAGRLPVSIPRTEGQLPVHYNKLVPANHDYVELEATPLYPFGFGRSYTRFEYGNQAVDSLGRNDYRIRCTVRNCGERDGEEVAQLYIRHLEAPLVQPLRELKAFERIAIPAGEEREVEFRLTPRDLQIIGRDYRPMSYEGRVRIEVGPSSAEHPLVDTLRRR